MSTPVGVPVTIAAENPPPEIRCRILGSGGSGIFSFIPLLM